MASEDATPAATVEGSSAEAPEQVEAAHAPQPDESGEDTSAVAGTPAIETPEEPKPILIWRPARFEPRQRHGREGHRGRRDGDTSQRGRAEAGQQRGRGGASRSGPPADGQAGPTPPPEQNRPPRHGKPKFEKDRGRQRTGGAPDSEAQAGRGPGRRDGGKPFTPSKPREERAPRFDPDSPFAKLAALRDLLKK
jgi:ATP-dependent RNA helicase SUPV3L1/SUV3